MQMLGIGRRVVHKGSKLSRLLIFFCVCVGCLNSKLICCYYAGLMFGCGGGVCMIDYNISTIAFTTFTAGTAYISYLARLNAAVGSPERRPHGK